MTDNSLNLSQVIRKRLKDADKRFWAGDNISEFITEKEKDMLVDELTLSNRDSLTTWRKLVLSK